MNFVLDCSMTMAWFLEDETTPYMDSVQDTLCAGSDAPEPPESRWYRPTERQDEKTIVYGQ